MRFSTFSKKDRIRRELQRIKVCKKSGRRFTYKRVVPNDSDYFDLKKIKKIETFIDTNPELALSYISNYLIDYPNDYYVRTLYATTLISLRQLDIARLELEKIEDMLLNDGNVQKYCSKVENITHSILYAKLKYYTYKGQYKNANMLISNNPDLLTCYNLDTVRFYIKVMLNASDKIKYFKNTYIFNQILRYREDYMLTHIMKHLILSEDHIEINSVVNPELIEKKIRSKKSKRITKFVADFPIDRVIKDVKQYLVDENAIYYGFFDDIYYFRYDDCGKVDNTYSNYFIVICLHGTKNIITILPTLEYVDDMVIDLNYIKKDIQSRVKVLTVINGNKKM